METGLAEDAGAARQRLESGWLGDVTQQVLGLLFVQFRRVIAALQRPLQQYVLGCNHRLWGFRSTAISNLAYFFNFFFL